ncbi:MAG: DUF1566 domain-containing protein [Desulfobacteraceae bacterium]|nr:DUF1566 domain-containing protein [Desulfobacteraceae bacterium]
MKAFLRTAGLLAGLLILLLATSAHAALTVGNYTLVSSKRLTRTDYEYTYRAQVTNTGAAAKNVMAQATSSSSNTTIIEGLLEFGAVAAGAAVTSSDTFVIRHNRSFPLDWSVLSWRVAQGEAVEVIGVQGGNVAVVDPSSPLSGVEVNIPAGATQGNTAISISTSDHLGYSEDPNQNIAPVIDLGPSGTVFQVPVNITFPYDPLKLENIGIVDPHSLKIYTYDEDASIWLPLDAVSIDTERNTITASTTHFSLFTVAGDTLTRHGNLLLSSIYSPVIFLHGVMVGAASQNLKGNAYNTFGIVALEALYNEGVNVYALNYDTAKGIDEAAISLALAIGRIKQETGSAYVNIIAHSMGGLVARAYLQNMASAPWLSDQNLIEKIRYQDDVAKIMMLGTPNHGSLFSVLGSLSHYTRTTSLTQMIPNSPFLLLLNNEMFPPNTIVDIVYGSVELLNGDGVVSLSSAVLSPDYPAEIFRKYSEHVLNGYYHIKTDDLPVIGDLPLWELGVSKVEDLRHPAYDLMLKFAIDKDIDGVTEKDNLDKCPGTGIRDIANENGCAFVQLRPQLISPPSNAENVNPALIKFTWSPIQHPDHLPVEYCISIKENSEPNDISVYERCELNHFLTDPAFQTSLGPGRAYVWAVFAKDQTNNWSQLSNWFTFTTAPDPNDVDNDNDGYSENQGDCNDNNASIHPHATEICGDGIDQDCSGADLSCSQDTDGDGLPDWWEIQYGLIPTNSADGSFDFDGDGYTNLQEFAANTDPTDEDSHPVSTITGKIPDTGQTTSYTNTFGEDADYSINPQSYTKLDANGNALPDSAATWAMVRDNVTGLIWENKTDDGGIHDKDNTYTWQGAQDIFIAQLNAQNFGGHHDWRMPRAIEFSMIVNAARYNPSVNTNYFANTMPTYYWSSTTSAYGTDYAWYVGFNYGNDSFGAKSNGYHVRAVRGGQALTGTLVDNGNGTISDTATGLMWQKAEPGTMTWEAALDYCANLQLAGYSDWRLPNRNELQTIVDDSRYNPAIDRTIFPGAMSSGYWSSSTYAQGNDYAWYVNFYYGGVSSNNKPGSYNVRAVRSIQSSPQTISTPVNIHAEYQSVHSWNYITWDAVPGAYRYNVYWGTAPYVEKTSELLTLLISKINGTKFSV